MNLLNIQGGNSESELTRKEFDDAVDSMKNSKATGTDKIPAEVWKNSKVVIQTTVFLFLKKV